MEKSILMITSIGIGRGGGLSGWSNGDLITMGMSISTTSSSSTATSNQNVHLPTAGGIGSGDLTGVTAIPEPGVIAARFGLRWWDGEDGENEISPESV
jgi:hypothetical protein